MKIVFLILFMIHFYWGVTIVLNNLEDVYAVSIVITGLLILSIFINRIINSFFED